MKILSISNLDIWPAGENKGIPSIFFSQKGFVQRGHEVFFLSPAKMGKRGQELYQGIKIFRFKFPFLRLFSSISSLRLDRFCSHIKSTFLSNLELLFFQLLSLFWAIKIGCKLRPDLIYVHSLTPSFVGWLASKLLRTRLVFRIYGTIDLYWKFRRPLARIKEFRSYLVFKLRPDYFVITRDGTQGARLAKKLGVREEKIIDYRNGVDFSMYAPNLYTKEKLCQELGIGTDSKIILSLSKLIPFYAVERLIFSLVELFKVDPHIVCIVARDGPEMAKLKEFVSNNNIENRVIFVGYVDREFVKKLLNVCDVFVSVSEYSNTNNALFEAMVCARCIVTLKDETIEETLTHKKNAILVPLEELNSLSNILGKVLSDDSMRERLGRQAQSRAREILESWPERIDREAQLLEALIKS
ncbi:MAG: glycosyltransferase family 4 protein [Candidatus Omnitrophica bacterium]|nr:glycosyltransferase family 4 protein [Candidatus Omnitrophota bacterium]